MKDEYIHKSDALNAISCDITITGKKNAEIVCKAIASFADGIKALPPADVAPVVHGKWIFVHPLSPDDGGAYLCSECEKGDWDIKLSDKFCKFCGAKMDKE